MTNNFVPPRKNYRCPHCKAVCSLMVHPACPIDGRLAFECYRCLQAFLYVKGNWPSLFTVRCDAFFMAVPILLLELAACVFGCWLLFHYCGLGALAALLIAASICWSSRHEGVKSLPLTVALFFSTVALTRGAMLVLHHFHYLPDLNNMTQVCAGMVLVIAACAWFGALPANYIPVIYYPNELYGNDTRPDNLTQEQIEASGGL